MSSPFGDYGPTPPNAGPPSPNYGRPAWAPAPMPSRGGSGRIVGFFVLALVVLAVVAGVVIFLGRPAPPVAPCAPAQPCAPVPSLPVVGASPGAPLPPPRGTPLPVPQPSSGAPVVISGTLYSDSSLGYGFEYEPDVFALGDTGAGFAVLTGQPFDAQVWVDAKTADTSPSQMIQAELAAVDKFLIARVPDPDTYDALLGPSIGYVPGDGGVWSGTIIGRDGNPVAPGGVTIVSATDGRITVAVVVIVGTPDARQGGDTQQHEVRRAADGILKTFKWSVQ